MSQGQDALRSEIEVLMSQIDTLTHEKKQLSERSQAIQERNEQIKTQIGERQAYEEAKLAELENAEFINHMIAETPYSILSV